MATLTCSRCKATTQADSIKEGRDRLDHAVGLSRGKPCADGKAELFLTGKVNTPKKEKPKSEKADKVGNTKKSSFYKE